MIKIAILLLARHWNLFFAVTVQTHCHFLYCSDSDLAEISNDLELAPNVKARKLKYYGHIMRSERDNHRERHHRRWHFWIKIKRSSKEALGARRGRLAEQCCQTYRRKKYLEKRSPSSRLSVYDGWNMTWPDLTWHIFCTGLLHFMHKISQL